MGRTSNVQMLQVEAIWSNNRPSHVSASEVFLTVSNKITEQYRTAEAFSLSMQRLECSILRKGKVAFLGKIRKRLGHRNQTF